MQCVTGLVERSLALDRMNVENVFMLALVVMFHRLVQIERVNLFKKTKCHKQRLNILECEVTSPHAFVYPHITFLTLDPDSLFMSLH